MSTLPSTTTKENGGRSSSTQRQTLGSRRIDLPFRVSAPVVKTMLPSSSRSNQIGATCGRPSFLTVASFPVRGGSAVRKAFHSSSLMTRMAAVSHPAAARPARRSSSRAAATTGPASCRPGWRPEAVDGAADAEGGVDAAARVEDGSADAAHALLPFGHAGRPAPAPDRLQLGQVDPGEPGRAARRRRRPAAPSRPTPGRWAAPPRPAPCRAGRRDARRRPRTGGCRRRARTAGPTPPSRPAGPRAPDGPPRPGRARRSPPPPSPAGASPSR